MNNNSDSVKVRLSIFSTLQDLGESGLPEGDAEKSNVTVVGGMKEMADGSLLVSYKESSEGGEILSDIRIGKGKIHVRRRGAIESTMIFEEQVIHKSVYTMPPYSMDMEIFTKKIRNSFDRSGGEITLIYEMKIGGSLRSAVFKVEASLL